MFNMLSSVEMSIVYNCFIISHDLTRTVSFMYLNVCKATLTKAWERETERDKRFLNLSLDLCCKNYTFKPQPTVLETKGGMKKGLYNKAINFDSNSFASLIIYKQ